MMISTFDCLFLGAIAVVILYLYLSWNYNHWKKLGIEYEKPLIPFGNMKDAFIGKKPMGLILTEIYEKFPGRKVVGWFKLRTPALLIRDPELVHRILTTDFNSFRNNDVELDEDLDPILGRNIFVLKDESWKKSRALITPAFTAGKIKAVFPSMIEVAKDMVQFLKQHPEEFHVKNLMARYTAEIVARCAFGIEGNNFKHTKPEMYELGKQIFAPNLGRNFVMLAFFMMPKITKLFRLKMVHQNVIDFFNGILRDVIVHRQENKLERNDLVQYLIEVKRKSLEVEKGNIQSDIVTRPYTDDDILSGCVMFFIEGFETSSLIINNVLYQLAIHKDIQDNLRAEIDEALKEGELTFETVNSLNYLNCVYLESHRVLPAMFHLQKLCTEEYEMDIGKSKPLVIPKGTTVALPVYAIHMDPLYWDDPESFKPERFANKEDATAKSKGFYAPFGDGPRMCPGYRIATTLVKVAIINIVANFEILPTSKTPQKISPDPYYFMIGHKGGIHLRFAERSR